MFLTPYKRHAVSVLAAVTLLSGCGLTQRVTDGTKEVASAIFYKQIKSKRRLSTVWQILIFLRG